MLLDEGKYDEAESYLVPLLETSRRILGNEHPDNLWTIETLSKVYEAWRKPEEAQMYRDMLPAEVATTQGSEN